MSRAIPDETRSPHVAGLGVQAEAKDRYLFARLQV
jgi:hypothetical protein